jgi:hypothetical protein
MLVPCSGTRSSWNSRVSCPVDLEYSDWLVCDCGTKTFPCLLLNGVDKKKDLLVIYERVLFMKSMATD